MVTITFKNVDQGDSIILEYERNGKNLVTIIDCKKTEDYNPVLDYIIEKKYHQIEFLILSHPHLDHCSGFLELIEYCLKNNILIERFLYTGSDLAKYWKDSLDTTLGSEYLLKLYALLNKAYYDHKIILNVVDGESINPAIRLTKDISLQIMSPTHTERQKWFNSEYPAYPEEELGNKPNVNFLSTIVKIYSNDWYVLLTADVDKTTLIYYDKKKPEELQGRLVLAQSPHHGSGANHNNTFWKNRLVNNQRTIIVFSVGKNGYNHPAKDTVDFFMSNGFDIYSTNQVGALSKTTVTAKERSDALDSFGTALNTKRDRFNGDKTFQIDLAGTVTLV